MVDVACVVGGEGGIFYLVYRIGECATRNRGPGNGAKYLKCRAIDLSNPSTHTLVPTPKG